MNTNFKVFGLIELRIKPESTAQETDAPYHSPIVTSFLSNYITVISILTPAQKLFRIKVVINVTPLRG